MTLAGSGAPDGGAAAELEAVSYQMQTLRGKVAHRLRQLLERVSNRFIQEALSKTLHKMHLKKDR